MKDYFKWSIEVNKYYRIILDGLLPVSEIHKTLINLPYIEDVSERPQYSPEYHYTYLIQTDKGSATLELPKKFVSSKYENKYSGPEYENYGNFLLINLWAGTPPSIIETIFEVLESIQEIAEFEMDTYGTVPIEEEYSAKTYDEIRKEFYTAHHYFKASTDWIEKMAKSGVDMYPANDEKKRDAQIREHNEYVRVRLKEVGL